MQLSFSFFPFQAQLPESRQLMSPSSHRGLKTLNLAEMAQQSGILGDPPIQKCDWRATPRRCLVTAGVPPMATVPGALLRPWEEDWLVRV